MRKILHTMFIIMLLFICTMLFVSCEAITAQNITNTGSDPQINIGQNAPPRMNGGQEKNRDSGDNGDKGPNDGPRINESQPN